jgi:hypothetical protein
MLRLQGRKCSSDLSDPGPGKREANAPMPTMSTRSLVIVTRWTGQIDDSPFVRLTVRGRHAVESIATASKGMSNFIQCAYAILVRMLAPGCPASTRLTREKVILVTLFSCQETLRRIKSPLSVCDGAENNRSIPDAALLEDNWSANATIFSLTFRAVSSLIVQDKWSSRWNGSPDERSVKTNAPFRSLQNAPNLRE